MEVNYWIPEKVSREGFNLQRRDDPTLDEYEDALWCDISSQGSELDILLGIVYRNDNNTKDKNDCVNKELRRIGEERKEVMVIGDFNYREIYWETMHESRIKKCKRIPGCCYGQLTVPTCD